MSIRTMDKSRASISKVASLRPELEFEVIKLTLLREKYIQRLTQALSTLKKELDISIVGLVDVLRDTSIQVVETIITWERAQVNYPVVKPYIWNGEEYLLKMVSDMDVFANNKQLCLWLGFNLENNPFFVPHDIFNSQFSLGKQSYVAFGIPPHKRASSLQDPTGSSATKPLTKKKAGVSSLQSPYNTPIINDTKLLPSASVTRAKELIKQRKANKGVDNEKAESVNVYETYLTHETIQKLRRCWSILCERFKEENVFLEQFIERKEIQDGDGRSGRDSHVGTMLTAIEEHPQVSPIEQSSEHTALEDLSVDDSGRCATAASVSNRSSDDGPGLRRSMNINSASSEFMPEKQHQLVRTQLNATTDSFLNHRFKESLELSTAVTADVSSNKFMRIQYIDKGIDSSGGFGANTSLRFGTVDIATQPHVWTTHDVKLQRAVHRKGGELFTLTAAGTQGRMKAPYRKSRLERMQTDYEHIKQQIDLLTMSLEDTNINHILKEASAVVDPGVVFNSDADAESHKPFIIPTIRRLHRGVGGLRVNELGVPEDPYKLVEKKAVNPLGAALLHPIVLDTEYIKETRSEYHKMEKSLKYQIETFKLIMHKDITTDTGYIKSLRNANPGQAHVSDEYLSMSLENKMAIKIQRKVRARFGRSVRRAIARKRGLAATFIQGVWRRYYNRKLSLFRGRQTKLAVLLQKLARGNAGTSAMEKLVREKLEKDAAVSIQRIYRGYFGRHRIGLKKEFLQCVRDATHAVSAKCLCPGDIEELADFIDFFIKDYRIDLPVGVITVLRGILFMFNGNKQERVHIHQAGYFRPLFLLAKNSSYQVCLLILRRKCRFVRRLRSLIACLSPPDARQLPFNANCKTHLKSLVKNIKESDFDNMKMGKHAMVQLYRFCVAIHRASELQEYFPEFFKKSLPNWFKQQMILKGACEKARVFRMIAIACSEQVTVHREEYSKKGMRWKAVSVATTRAESDLKKATEEFAAAKKALDYYVARLVKDEQLKLEILEGLKRARALGVVVAKRDLQDYLSNSIAPEASQVKALEYELAEREYMVLEAEANVVVKKQVIKANEEARNYDNIFDFKKIHGYCNELGRTLGDLYVLANNWDEFVTSVGGEQFLEDVKGATKDTYVDIKKNALRLMTKRKRLMRKLDVGLQNEINKVLTITFNSIKIPHWDTTTPVMEEAEVQEDRECAKIEADVHSKQRRSLDLYRIEAKPAKAVLLLMDRRIPRRSKECIVKRLHALKFRKLERDQCDPDLVGELQELLDGGFNAILPVDRGLDRVARNIFVTRFESLLGCMMPRPKVVCLDASATFIFENWHTMFSAGYEDSMSFDAGENDRVCLSLGKCRRVGSLFTLCMTESRVNTGFINYSENSSVDADNYSDRSTAMIPEEKHEPLKPGTAGKMKGFQIPKGLDSLEGNEGIKEGSLLDSLQPLPNQEASIITKGTHVTQKSHALPNFTTGSILLSIWSHCSVGVTGFGKSTPMWFRNRCYQDFQEFCNDISGVAGASDGASFNSASLGELSQLSCLEHSGKVLAATIAALLDVWKAPLLPWREGEIRTGCGIFLDIAEDTKEFCDMLMLRQVPVATPVKTRKIRRAKELVSVWRCEYDQMDISVHPARYLMSLWCLEAMELLDVVSRNGGAVDENDEFAIQRSNIEHYRAFDWNLDAYTHGAEAVVGELLEECYRDHLLYEDMNCPVTALMRGINIENTTGQMILQANCRRHVRVYQVGSDALVAVRLNKGELLSIRKSMEKVMLQNSMVSSSVVMDGDGGPGPSHSQVLELENEDLAGVSYASHNENSNWYYFTMIPTEEVINSLRPNCMEMFDGCPPTFNLGLEDGQDKWFEMLTKWTKFDTIGEHFEVSSTRVRSLLLSKLGFLDGYHCRLEIFEEKYGEIYIIIHGILGDKGLLSFRFTRKIMSELLFCADEHEEKEKLEAVDCHAMAGICSDRLSITPSRRWGEFLHYNAFYPSGEDVYRDRRRVRVSMRSKRGPGRHVGKKAVKVAGLTLIITIYEIMNETESHSLRIVVYEPKHSQTVEYRLSPMERLALFVDDVNLFSQIVKRLHTVYCDTSQPTRTLIRIQDSEFKPDIESFRKAHPDEDENVDEHYEICTERASDLFQNSESESESGDSGVSSKNGSSLGSGSVVDEGVEEGKASVCVHSVQSDESSVSGSNSSASEVQSARDNFNFVESDDDSSIGVVRDSSHISNGVSEGSVLDRNFKLAKIDDVEPGLQYTPSLHNGDANMVATWGWALYFNRTVVSRTINNIQLSMGLNLNEEGFFLYALDVDTLTEAYQFLDYEMACNMYYDKTVVELQLELATTVDESVVYDLVDDLLNTVEIEEDEEHDDFFKLNLISERTDDQPSITIAILKVKPEKEESESGSASGSESESVARLESVENCEDESDSLKSEGTSDDEAESATGSEVGPTALARARGGGGLNIRARPTRYKDPKLPKSPKPKKKKETEVYEVQDDSLKIIENKHYFLITSPLLHRLAATIKWSYHFPKWSNPIVTAKELVLSAEHVLSKAATFNSKYGVEGEGQVEEGNAKKIDIVTVKYKMELPAVTFVDKSQELKEESRICWRGRVKPKNVHCADGEAAEAKKKAFQPLHSKLAINHELEKLKVVAEYMYLEDEAKMVDKPGGEDLPICVREVVSEGAGAISRMFRIDVLTNSGMKFGFADIKDEEDLEKVVGLEMNHLLKGNDRDLSKVFEYVVRERLVLNMMPMKRKTGAGGRREGVRVAAGAGSAAGSLASLMRDEIPPKEDAQGGNVVNTRVRRYAHRQADVDTTGASADKNCIRIFQKTHRTAGRSFRTLVMLISDDRDFFYDTDRYIKRFVAEQGLYHLLISLTLEFKSFDNLNKISKSLFVKGRELFDWLPDGYPLDVLTTKFRRGKFGEYLLNNLRVVYSDIPGQFHLELVKRKKKSTDLAASFLRDRGAVKVKPMLRDSSGNVISASPKKSESKLKRKKSVPSIATGEGDVEPDTTRSSAIGVEPDTTNGTADWEPDAVLGGEVTTSVNDDDRNLVGEGVENTFEALLPPEGKRATVNEIPDSSLMVEAIQHNQLSLDKSKRAGAVSFSSEIDELPAPSSEVLPTQSAVAFPAEEID